MSDTDSFIDEVTEEVRRDRLFQMLKRYGWIGAVAVVLIVGGATWREISLAKQEAAAQELGDQLRSALELNDAAERADALAKVGSDNSSANGVADLLEAAALVEAEQAGAATTVLETVAVNSELPQVYRDIAAFKALLLNASGASVADRRIGFETLAAAGNPLQFLATEQLALLDIEEGDTDAAIERLNGIYEAAGVSRDLKQRVERVIVALGGTVRSTDNREG